MSVRRKGPEGSQALPETRLECWRLPLLQLSLHPQTGLTGQGGSASGVGQGKGDRSAPVGGARGVGNSSVCSQMPQRREAWRTPKGPGSSSKGARWEVTPREQFAIQKVMGEEACVKSPSFILCPCSYKTSFSKNCTPELRGD